MLHREAVYRSTQIIEMCRHRAPEEVKMHQHTSRGFANEEENYGGKEKKKTLVIVVSIKWSNTIHSTYHWEPVFREHDEQAGLPAGTVSNNHELFTILLCHFSVTV